MASISARQDRDGNHIGWRAQIRRRGHAPQVKTFRRRADAEAWARDVEARMDRGVFADTRDSERTTLADILNRYAREVTPGKKSASLEAGKIAMLKRTPLAERSVAAITGADLAGWRDARLLEVTGSTVNRELTILSHVFSTAEKEWRITLPRGNPVGAMRRPKMNGARDRRLAEEEEARLIAACEKYESEPRALPLSRIVKFALATAMRRAEITRMRWEDVDLRARALRVPETKSGDPRTVPLARCAIEVLDSQPRRLDGWVWKESIDPHSVTRAFERACRRARIDDLRFHDLRHEAISRLFERTDLDMMEIARISGHRSLSMLARYTHLRVGRLADRLDGAKRGG